MLDRVQETLKLKEIFYNPEFILFFRVSIGIVILLHFISYWQDFDLLYGKNSIIPIELNKAYEGTKYITTTDILLFLEKYFTYNSSILIFKGTFAALCICIILGFYSRVSALLLLFLQISVVKSGIQFSYGADYFESMSLFYIIFFPSDIRFSQLNTKTRDFTIFKRTIQWHLCISYFFSGFDKILGFNWWNGESIWKASHLPNFTRYIELNSITDNPIVYIILGWITLIVEIFYPLFININRTRKVWLFLTIGMHVGIIILFNLYFFASIMIIWNLTAYYFNYYDDEKV